MYTGMERQKNKDGPGYRWHLPGNEQFLWQEPQKLDGCQDPRQWHGNNSLSLTLV